MTGKTYDFVGAKEVLLYKTNKHNLRFTVWLAITSKGEKLKPVLIFKTP